MALLTIIEFIGDAGESGLKERVVLSANLHVTDLHLWDSTIFLALMTARLMRFSSMICGGLVLARILSSVCFSVCLCPCLSNQGLYNLYNKYV